MRPKKSEIDTLSGQPILVPPKIYARVLRFLKRAKKAANKGSDYLSVNCSDLAALVADFEHAGKVFVQK